MHVNDSGNTAYFDSEYEYIVIQNIQESLINYEELSSGLARMVGHARAHLRRYYILEIQLMIFDRGGKQEHERHGTRPAASVIWILSDAMMGHTDVASPVLDSGSSFSLIRPSKPHHSGPMTGGGVPDSNQGRRKLHIPTILSHIVHKYPLNNINTPI